MSENFYFRAPGAPLPRSTDDRASAAPPPREALRKALSLVWRAGQAWALDNAQIHRLLGDPDGVLVPTWFGNPTPVLAAPSLRRIGLVIALWRLLRRLDPRPGQDLEWLATPHPRLNGPPPLDWLLAGGLGDLLAVHAVLAAEVESISSKGYRRPPRLTPLERALRQALRGLCAVERDELAPPFPTSRPAITFDAWSDVERWLWDGDGDEDAPVRARIAELTVVAGRVLGGDEAARRWLIEPQVWIGGKPSLVAAVTPGGAHRARMLLRIIETMRAWFHAIGVLPDEGGDPGPSSPRRS